MIFTQCLHSAVNNAHVLHKQYCNLERYDDGYSFLSFIELIIKEMSSLYSENWRDKAAVSPHMCLPVYSKRDPKAKKDGRKLRRQCRNKKSVVKCNACGVVLCVIPLGIQKRVAGSYFMKLN